MPATMRPEFGAIRDLAFDTETSRRASGHAGWIVTMEGDVRPFRWNDDSVVLDAPIPGPFVQVVPKFGSDGGFCAVNARGDVACFAVRLGFRTLQAVPHAYTAFRNVLRIETASYGACATAFDGSVQCLDVDGVMPLQRPTRGMPIRFEPTAQEVLEHFTREHTSSMSACLQSEDGPVSVALRFRGSHHNTVSRLALVRGGPVRIRRCIERLARQWTVYNPGSLDSFPPTFETTVTLDAGPATPVSETATALGANGESLGLGNSSASRPARGDGGMRVGRVRIDNLSVNGGLSLEVVRRVVRRHTNEFQFCCEQEHQTRPGPSARANIDFTISSTGTVSRAAVSNGTSATASLEQCIVDAIQRWTFPQVDGGGTVTVALLLTLEPPVTS